MARNSERGMAACWKILRKLRQEKISVLRDLQGTAIDISKKENTCLIVSVLFLALAADDAPQIASQT
jgi:hypothetical protein